MSYSEPSRRNHEQPADATSTAGSSPGMGAVSASGGPPSRGRRAEDRPTNETTRTTRAGRLAGLPDRLGPCKLIRPIGSGGMGTVYLGEMVEERPYAALGAQIAVKILHPELVTSEDIFNRFVREGRLGATVSHAHVVRTHEAQQVTIASRAVHFLVMEYVEGRTLRDLLEESHVIPESLLRQIGAQISRGLEAVHEAGAVHRDLKPPNVLISRDNNVKLSDLGVACLLDDSARLTTTGDFVGTLHYAAPEQFRGERVGAASDLYSLGLMLYEGATGTQPFAADEFSQVMRRHLEHVPPRASQVNPQISAFFEEVLACLMDKSPARRFASARELAEVLEQGEASDWWIRRSEIMRASAPGMVRRRIAIGRSTAMIGRDREVADLLAVIHEAQRGEGRAVLVQGEAGIGKTRLIDELFRALDDEAADVHALHGVITPGASASRVGAFVDAVLAHFGDVRLQSELNRWLSATPQLVPVFNALLAGASHPGGEPPAADAVSAAFVAIARSLAAERPVVWVVEDLHLGSPEAHALFLALARSVHGQRLVVMGTTRQGLPAETVGAIDRLEGLRRVDVGRLAPREMMQMLREAIRTERLVETLAPKIIAKADGNPFFAFATLEQLEQEHVLRRRSDGSLTANREIRRLEVPSAVRGLLLARVEGLSERERASLDVAAVQGFSFDADLIARVLKRERLEVLQTLADVERRTGIVRSNPTGFTFDHHQMYEVLLGATPQTLRDEYHAMLAQSYEEREGLLGKSPDQVDGEAAVFLSRHFLEGGRTSRGSAFAPGAIAHLSSMDLNEDALQLADLAIKLIGGDDPALRCEVRLRQAAVLELTGRRDAARVAVQDARSAAEISKDPRAAARARCDMARLLLIGGSYEGALDELREARERARLAKDPQIEARAVGLMGVAYDELGQTEAGIERLDLALATFRQVGDAAGVAWATSRLAVAYRHLGRHETARQLLDKALPAFQELHDRRGEAVAHSRLGSLWLALGQHQRAREHHERALALARRIGDRRTEGTANGGLAGVAIAMGQMGLAREHCDEQLAIAREIGHRKGEASALELSALVALFEGRVDDAGRMLDECLGTCRAMGSRRLEARALNLAGHVALGRGDREAARLLYDQALTSRRAQGAREGIACSALSLGRHLLESALAEGGAPIPPDAETSIASGSHMLRVRELELALPLLEESRDLTAEMGVVEPGPLPRACLALAGACRPQDVEIDGNVPAPVRAEAHLLLYRACLMHGEPPLDHLEQARTLIERMATALVGAEREFFSSSSPLARELRAAEVLQVP